MNVERLISLAIKLLKQIVSIKVFNLFQTQSKARKTLVRKEGERNLKTRKNDAI